MIAARPSAHGFVVGEPRARRRGESLGIEIRHPRHCRTPGAAVRALLGALASVEVRDAAPTEGTQLDIFGNGRRA